MSAIRITIEVDESVRTVIPKFGCKWSRFYRGVFFGGPSKCHGILDFLDRYFGEDYGGKGRPDSWQGESGPE
jgi:hypothetical protein